MEYEREHTGLLENIQTDILEWLEKVNKYLVKEDPFREEAIFIENQKLRDSEDIASDLIKDSSKMEYHYKRLPSISDSKRGAIEASTVNFDFYHNQFIKEAKIVKSKNEKGDEIEFTVIDSKDNSPITHPLDGRIFYITYVLHGWGIKDGWCVFGIKEKEDGQA